VFLNAKRNDDTQIECDLQMDLSCPDSLLETITSKVNIVYLLSLNVARPVKQKLNSVLCYMQSSVPWLLWGYLSIAASESAAD